jgi:hypothetical protein
MKNFNEFIIFERKINYKNKLCPDIWENNHVIERIKEKLLRIARDFYKDLDINTEISDIILTGSISNYNYTASSDLDVHIIIDFSEVNEDVSLVKKAFDGQRFIWNLKHNIIIKGHDVELYVQDKNETHVASGQYSLLNSKWLIKPSYNPPNVNTEDIDIKYDARVYDIEELEKISKAKSDSYDSEQYYNNSKDLLKKIMKSRKDGLSTNGEFSIENLVFKKLRKEGKIEKLINTTNRLYDKIYSQ